MPFQLPIIVLFQIFFRCCVLVFLVPSAARFEFMVCFAFDLDKSFSGFSLTIAPSGPFGDELEHASFNP